jgi:hypothetical protein
MEEDAMAASLPDIGNAEAVTEVDVPGTTTGFRRDSVLRRESNLTEQYTYVSLDDVTKDIRLCSITPAPEGSGLAVNLRSVKLSDKFDSFRCLSYVWGDPGSISILLNGRRHNVRPNLHFLLERMRALGIHDDLWIDALCINQDDEAEKSEQVKLMGMIYSGARGVLVGLEVASLETKESQRGEVVEATIRALAQNSHLSELAAFAARPVVDACAGSQDAFRRLLKSPYFSRAWVVQELCLSKDTRFLCSWGLLPWQTFVQAFENWNQHRTDCCALFADNLDKEMRSACYRVYCAVKAMEYTMENLQNEQHLIELLLLYQHLAATDEKDKIFAFQGLHTAKAELPSPDYEKTKAEVYQGMALWMLQDARSLMPLALNLHGDPDLPSWVMDYSASPPIEPNYWRNRLRFHETYDACKGLDWSFEYRAPRTLRVFGTRVDHIQYAARPNMAYEGPAEHAKLLKEWYAFAGGGIAPFIDADAVDDTFVETMLASRSQDDTGIHEAGTEDLAAWKKILFHLIQDASLEHDQTSTRLMACHMTATLGRTLFRTYRNWGSSYQ